MKYKQETPSEKLDWFKFEDGPLDGKDDGVYYQIECHKALTKMLCVLLIISLGFNFL